MNLQSNSLKLRVNYFMKGSSGIRCKLRNRSDDGESGEDASGGVILKWHLVKSVIQMHPLSSDPESEEDVEVEESD